MDIPRPEHPRCQFRRESWINLNGTWTFAFDFGKSGIEASWHRSRGFDRRITVPFCPESTLSGVGYADFIEAMWYHRTIDIPPDWSGRRILLHFGGVDYESEVYIDGQSVGAHFGGTVSFTHDITPFVQPGRSHDLVVRVGDETRRGNQPRGKQCSCLHSQGCSYTRTTGIWQTVWLEASAPCGLASIHIVPDFDGGRFIVTPRYHAQGRGLTLRTTLSAGDEVVAGEDVPASQGAGVVLAPGDRRPWSPDDPFLYDLRLDLLDVDAGVIDTVFSYAGLRKIHVEGNRVLLNNEPLYQRLVLDQGFYPDGIWTAPSDEALKRDIELAQRAGFNGARLHQKVFEERFHTWADRLGYLTWGESASWGCDVNTADGARNFLTEWRDVLLRDRNHPSIIAWTPFNETGRVTDARQHTRVQVDACDLCGALDPTRPVNDTSGYVHAKTDLWTVHRYEQDPAKLREDLTPGQDGVFRNMPDLEAEYAGQPYLVDEFGGIKWNPDADDQDASQSWGYGQTPATLDDFYERLEALTGVILELDHIRGYCYTQLTDVEQEQNGIYRYDRSEKFDMDRIAANFQREPCGPRMAPAS